MRALPLVALLALVMGMVFVAGGGHSSSTGQARLPSVGANTVPAVPDPIGVYIVKADGSGLKLLTTISGRPMWSWSANGDRAALVTDIAGGTAKVHVLSVPDGAEQATFATDGRPIDMSWSPDGEWLALTYSSPDQTVGLEVIRTDGSTREDLTALSGYSGQLRIVGWTGADKLLAVREETSSDEVSSTELLEFDLTGGGSRQVATLPGWSNNFTLSRDASRVAALVGPPSSDCPLGRVLGLWTIDMADGQAKNVLPDRCGLFAAVWSPDGSQIAYSVATEDETRGVYALDLASGNDRRLGGSTTQYDEVQGWLPDGSGVITARNACPGGLGGFCTPVPPQIVLIPTSGGDEKIILSEAEYTLSPDGATLVNDKDGLQLFNIPSGTRKSIASPDSDWQFHFRGWSADGRWLSFIRSHSIGQRQFEVNADGSGLKRLADLNDWPDMPPWDEGEVPSPDGSEAAVLGQPLRIKDTQTSEAVTLDGANAAQASWSSDGGELVFASCPLSAEGLSDIYLVDASGTGLRQLTSDSARNCEPVFSPDGRKVAFVRLQDKVEQVVTLDLDTSEEKVLIAIEATDGADGDWPAWSPDGKLLALSLQGMGVYVMKADGSGAQRVVDTDWNGHYQFVATRWQSDSRLYFVSAANGGD
ncbi:MAG: hypothetical protein ABR978_04735 [Dehalococcoidia bacterium]